jgi:hypothetical protein
VGRYGRDGGLPAARGCEVGEPGELRRELVAFARRRRNAHGEAVLKDARDVAFEAAKMIDVGNDALAGSAGDWCDQRHATRRHIDKLAGEFTPVHQHVAPGEVDAHALLVAAFLAQRPKAR